MKIDKKAELEAGAEVVAAFGALILLTIPIGFLVGVLLLLFGSGESQMLASGIGIVGMFIGMLIGLMAVREENRGKRWYVRLFLCLKGAGVGAVVGLIGLWLLLGLGSVLIILSGSGESQISPNIGRGGAIGCFLGLETTRQETREKRWYVRLFWYFIGAVVGAVVGVVVGLIVDWLCGPAEMSETQKELARRIRRSRG